MKMNKRILSVALALALGLSAAGCSKNDDAFELQIFAGGYGTEMWEYVLELFEEDHPDVKIVTYMDSNANNRLAERWRQGNPPDFVFLEGEGLDRDGWLANDLLYDCTEWLKTAKVNGSDKLITEVADLGMFNRHTNSQGDEIIYGLPLLKNSYGVWYDQNWFEKNNLTFPKSYTALMEFGEEVRTKKSDGGAAAATMIYPADNAAGYLVQGFILPALAAYGDSAFTNAIITASDPDVFADARFVDVMQRFMDFVAAGNMLNGTLSLDHTQSQLRWLKHDAALIPNGLWLRSELQKDAEDDGSSQAFASLDMRYGASPLCLDDQKPAVVATTIDCGIPAGSDKIDLAKEFITYLYREDVAKMFAKCANTPSAVNVDLSDVDISDTLKYTQEIMNSDDYLQVFKTGSWGAVDSEFNKIVNEIVEGKNLSTALDYCKRLQKVAQDQL